MFLTTLAVRNLIVNDHNFYRSPQNQKYPHLHTLVISGWLLTFCGTIKRHKSSIHVISLIDPVHNIDQAVVQNY